MSKISIYEVVPVPKLADKLVGTSVGGDPEDITYNFTLSELLNLFIPNIPGNTLQGVLDFGNTATQNINLTGIITTTTLNVGSTANILNSNLTGQTHITGGLYDRLNSIGTAGQVLTSTGTQVQWYTIPTVIPDLQQVLTSGNTAVNNIILTGNLSANNAALLTSTISTSLTLLGTLRDGLSSVGTNNQVLSSNVTGVRWINLPVYSATSPLLYNSGTGVFSIQQANASQNGYLSSADWITFDGKQTAISLTTTGNSGASTLVGATINVPNYTLSGLGGVPLTRTLTINGVTYNLAADRSWTLATGVSSVTATTPLSSTGGVNPDISIQQSSSSLDGYLSSTDWLTFNSKQPAGNYITSLTGEATAVGPGAASVILSNAAVIGKLLTGLSITGSAITSSDSILTAFGKVQNQINGLIGGVQFQGVWNAATNTPALVSSVGTQGYYYIVDVAGNTNLNGITDWQIGDWAIFNGSTWNKVDNTDLVTSVNGQIGAVSLTTDNIPEGATNLYYLDSRARAALSFAAGSGAYNGTTGVITIPTDNSQILNGAGYITLVSLSATSPLSYNNTTGAFSIQVANTTQNGYLSSTDWNTFNGKQDYLNGTGLVKSVAGVISYITDNSANWNTAYNDSIVSAAVTGTATKTLTLNQQDGGTITASWSDIDTGLTSVGVSMPSAFTVTNSPLTSNGTIAVTGSGNTLQYVDGTGALQTFPGLTGFVPYTGATQNVDLGIYNLTAASLIKNGGTSGQFLKADGSVDSSAYIVLGSLSATAPLSYNNTTGVFTISQSGASTNGYLSSTDWNTFNNKQATITLTTTGSSGAATLISNTLNIPDYGSALSGYVTLATAQTITGAKTFNDYQIFTNAITANSGIAFLNGVMPPITSSYYSGIGGNSQGISIVTRPVFTNYTNNLYFAASDNSFTFPAASGTIALVGGSGVGTVTSVSFTLGASGTDLNSSVTNSTTTPAITLNVPTASAANRGALSAADWSTFNTKVGGVTATTPLFSSGGSTPNLTIQQSSGSQAGYLSSTDWTTFNNKQAAGNYITSLTGEATATGPGAAAVTLDNASVTAKILTGVNITGGTILSTDSILTGFGKLQNQVNGLIGGSIYQGTWNANTNTPTLTSSVGTAGYYYIVSVAGNTNLNGITDWQVGDWAIFNGGVWQKVDNTDSVISVNGQTGAVSLTTDNISEGVTNLYFTNTRARAALSFVAGSGAYNSSTGAITIPTNTSQLTNGANFITLASLSGTAPITYNSGTGAISITQSGTASNGYLSSTDWNTFNNKQSALTNPVTGTGTANYLARWTSTSAIGIGITQDDGTVVWVGAGTGTASRMTINQPATGFASPVVLRIENENTTQSESAIRFRAKSSGGLNSHADIGVYATGADEGKFYIKFPWSDSQQTNVKFSITETGVVDMVNYFNIINSGGFYSLIKSTGASQSVGLNLGNNNIAKWGMHIQTTDRFAIFNYGTSTAPLSIDYSTNYIYALQRIGIGIAAPTAALEINGSGFGDALSIITTSVNGADIKLHNTGASGEEWHITSTGSNNDTGAGNLQFYNATDSATRFFLTSGGNAIIGTNNTSTGHRLTVYSATAAAQIRAAGAAPSILFTDTATNTNSYSGYVGIVTAANNFMAGTAAGDMVVQNYSGFPILFGIGNVIKMRIEASGQLVLTSTISNGTYTYTLPSATGTLALTSALSGYLPLTGGTLTGPLGGTSASFSSSVDATSLYATNLTTNFIPRATTSGQLVNSIIWTDNTSFSIGQTGGGSAQLTLNQDYTTITSPTVLRLQNSTTQSQMRFRAINGNYAHADVGVYADGGVDSGYWYVKFPYSDAVGTNVRLKIDQTGAATFTANSTTLNINSTSRVIEVIGKNSYYGLSVTGGSGVNTSYGAVINAGTNSNDVSFSVFNRAETVNYFQVRGDGAATFSSSVTASGNLNLQAGATRNINFYDSSNTNINAQIQYDQLTSNTGQLFFGTNNAGTFATRLTIASTGAATFSSDIFARIGTIDSRAFKIYEASASRGGLYPYNLVTGSGTDYSSVGIFSEAEIFFASGGSVTKKLRIESGGAATFSSSVTAGGDVNIPNGNYYYARRNTGSANINVLGIASGTDTTTLKGGSSGGATSIIFADTGGDIARFYNGNLIIGTTNTSTGHRLTVYSATETAQFRAAGAAPAILFTNTDTNTNSYVGYLGMATAANNFVSGAAAGDFVLHNYSGGPILLGINNVEKVRVTSTTTTFATIVKIPTQPTFSVKNGSAITINSTDTILPFDTEYFDIGSNYNTSNYRFTAPYTGKYLMTFEASMTSGGAHTYNAIYMLINGTGTSYRFRGPSNIGGGGWFGISGSVIIDLSAGQYVELSGYTDSSTISVVSNEGCWSGYYLG